MLAKALQRHGEPSANSGEVCHKSSNHHPVIGPKTNIQLDSYKNSCGDEGRCQSRKSVVHIELFLLA